MKHIFLLSVACLLAMPYAGAAGRKVTDNGGCGPYKAAAITEASLGKFAVYRPDNLTKAAKARKLPVLIWGNGGCSDSSIDYERMLTEIASHGYVVIALGELQMVPGDRRGGSTESSMMAEAIAWICKRAKDSESDYYNKVDTTLMAAAGHSCGGAQVLCNAADPHLKTYLICNAGMGDMEMAGASRQSLENLHGKILYLTGGEGDVAYANAKLDYARITNVPVFWADHSTAGHAATYKQPLGGDFGRMVLLWLNWTLKGDNEPAALFLRSDLQAFPGWTLQQKNL